MIKKKKMIYKKVLHIVYKIILTNTQINFKVTFTMVEITILQKEKSQTSPLNTLIRFTRALVRMMKLLNQAQINFKLSIYKINNLKIILLDKKLHSFKEMTKLKLMIS